MSGPGRAGYHPAVDRRRAGLLLSIGLVAACASPARSPDATFVPAATASPGASGEPEPTMDIERPGLTASTGQTDTAWGPIWNEVPPGFPVPAGAEPAEADSPVSAAYTVSSAVAPDARAIAQGYIDAFSFAGYGGGRDGPLEDGSYTAFASNGYGCDMLARAAPRGDKEIFVTVLYGAGCPFSWPVP